MFPLTIWPSGETGVCVLSSRLAWMLPRGGLILLPHAVCLVLSTTVSAWKIMKCGRKTYIKLQVAEGTQSQERQVEMTGSLCALVCPLVICKTISHLLLHLAFITSSTTSESATIMHMRKQTCQRTCLSPITSERSPELIPNLFSHPHGSS